MLNVSNAFNEAFKSSTRQVLVRVTMKDVVYTNNDVFDVEYVGGSITGETFNIGSVFSNSIKITFTKVIEAVKQLDKIKLEFGIVLADGSKEFVSMGYFFVDKYNPDRNSNRTIIESLDQMTQLERVYKSELTYPARIKDVALEIANLSGSFVDQASFERLSTSAINKIEGKTYRQAIGLIAQFAGGFAIFDRDGKLSIRTLSDPNFSISTAEYFSRGLVKNETMYTLGGISCKVTTKNGDTSTDFMLQSGSPLGNQIVLENSSMTQILLDGIYQQLKNTNYYPYTLSWRGNPALEAGDWISMSDTKANSFKMPNLTYKLSFSGGLKATSSADTSSVSQASASYRGPLKQQVLELQGWKSAAGGWTYTGTTEPSTPKEGDVWFKPNGPDTETLIYEGGKWVFQTSTAGIRQVTEEMNQAQNDIKDAVDSANNAVDKANENVQAIEANTQLITDVNAIANTAKSQAQTAATNAQTAVSNAGTAMSNSQAAITDAQNALDSYNNMVIGGVNILVTTTDEKIFQGNGAENQQAILSQLTKNSLADYGLKVGDKVSFSATCEISGSGFSGILTPRLRTSWTNLTQDYKAYTITKAEKIYFKSTFTMTEDRLANGTGVDFRADNVPSSVSMKWSEIQLEVGDKTTGYAPAPEEISVEITNINGQLRQKVSQTNFDILDGTVTNQSTQISQNKNDIASKANQTTVNTLTGRVSTAETNINQNKNNIELRATKTDVDTVKGRVASAEGSISLISGQVALKANQADVNTITGKVSSLESNFTVASGQISALNTKTDGQTTKIGSLQSSYDGLTSTVASVEDSLQQNNLVYNATLQGGSDGWELHNGYTQSSYRDINGNYVIDFSLASNSGNTWYFARSKQVPIGNYKTFSYAVSLMRRTDIANSSVFSIGIDGFDSTGNRIEYKSTNYNYQLTDDWWTVISDSYTFTNPDVKTVCFSLSTNGFGHYIACQPILVADSKVGSFVPDRVDKSQITQLTQNLDGFKTTVSNTYLSKSDASGTYADKVSVASQITQSATAVTSNVQSWTNNKLTAYSTTQQTATSITNAVASKADKSQITQLSDQITSTVTGITNESLLSTQMISSTTLKHPNYPEMPMVGIPVTNGESYTVSSNIPNDGTAAAPTAHVWFSISTSTTPNSAINGIYDGKSITLPAMSDKIYIVFRTQVTADRFISGKYWVKVTKTPASQSQITQLATDINLRVSKGDVTSQINIEAGRTLIDTKQLLLNANTVKFSGSAFIPDAMIQNLTASKINTGTLNAANVNIINLNASNITGGTLNAIDIKGSNITSVGENYTLNQKNGSITWNRNSDGKKVFGIETQVEPSNEGNTVFEVSKKGSLSIFSKTEDVNIYKNLLTFYNNADNGITASSSVDKIFVQGTDNSASRNQTYSLTISESGISYTSSKSTRPTFNFSNFDSAISFLVGDDISSISLIGGVARVKSKYTTISGDFTVTGSKNAIHATRDGVRATPAYETAESYLGDIGQNYTRENCEVWVGIEQLFSDTVNTDIAYQVFLQAYDDAVFWVDDFKSDKFLIKSDKPMSRFAWEIKAKRRGYENDRLVLQEEVDNKKIEEAWREK